MSIACIVNFSNVYWNEKPKILMVFNGLSWFLFRFLSRRRTMLQIKLLCYKATHHLQLSLLFYNLHICIALYIWYDVFFVNCVLPSFGCGFISSFYNLEILSNFLSRDPVLESNLCRESNAYTSSLISIVSSNHNTHS